MWPAIRPVPESAPSHPARRPGVGGGAISATGVSETVDQHRPASLPDALEDSQALYWEINRSVNRTGQENAALFQMPCPMAGSRKGTVAPL